METDRQTDINLFHVVMRSLVDSFKNIFLSSPEDIFSLLLEGEGGRAKGGRRTEREREKQRCEKHHSVAFSSDWEQNPRPLVYRTTLQATETHQPGTD